jgi:hypothetical protein
MTSVHVRSMARYEGMSVVASATANDYPFAVVCVREGDLRLNAKALTRSCEAPGQGEKADYRLVDCPTLIVIDDEDAVGPPSVLQELAGKIGGKTVIPRRCGRRRTAANSCREFRPEKRVRRSATP